MPPLRHTRLAFQAGSSDKVYEVALDEDAGGFVVTARYGRRGATLREDVKTPAPVPRAEAEALFDKLVAAKTKKGYVPVRPGHAPAARKPVDRAAQRAAILARLEAAVADPDAETDWPVERVLWRAGELRIAEAAPAALALLATGGALRAYGATWALGRLGQAAPNRAAALAAVVALREGDAPAHVRRIAGEAALRLYTDAERAAYAEALRESLPAAFGRAFVERDPEAHRAGMDALLAAVAPQDLADVDALYQIAYDDEAARASVLEIAQAVPLAAPFFVWVRHLYKAALFRDDAELFGRLAHRFATEASGLGDLAQGTAWSYEGDQHRTTYTGVWRNKATGLPEYRRTINEYKHGAWRSRKVANQTRVRTAAGPQWVDTDALGAADAYATASLGYTEPTRAYFRRRAWRTLRRLGEAGDAAYVKMAVGLLLAYTDADAEAPRTTTFDWYDWDTRTPHVRTTRYDAFAPYLAFNHVLYAHSPRYRLKKGNKAWALREGVEAGAPPPDEREEAFPELWDAQPEGLLHLLAESRCAPVHAFAVRALRANPAFLDRLGADEVRLLLGRPYPDTVGLGLDLARRLYDPAAPDRALVRALLAADLAEARALGLAWVGDQPGVFLADSAFAADLVVHPQADVRLGARVLLAAVPDLNAEALLARCLAALMALAPGDVSAAAVAADAGETLLLLFAEPLSRLSLRTIEDLVRHPALAVQAVGGRLLANHRTPPEALPGALLAALMTADAADVRAEGMALFGRLPDAALLDQAEVIEALALSPLADVRAAVRPVVVRLAAAHADFAAAIAAALLPVLLRSERVEGLHADLGALLGADAFAGVRAGFDRDRLWALLHARPVAAQDLGALVLAERDWSRTLTIRQIARLASHELVAVREAAWAMYEAAPDRMRAHPVDALALLDADWEDSRAFAMGYVERTFGADVWTPDLLVHVVDSVRPDVRAFGRRLIARFFDEGAGPTYLLRLSEHPAADVQRFASETLDAYASGHLERMEALVPYFRAVLGQVNRGRVAKDRVLAFLTREGARSEAAARLVAPLLAHHSATIAVGDKATTIEAMRDLQDARPALDLPLDRVPVPTYSPEAPDAV